MTTMTIDAITYYRQSILVWEETPETAFDLTAAAFGEAAAKAARNAFNSDPALRQPRE